MNFYTKVQPREELWNLTNKVPSGTRSKFESLDLFPTCGGRGLFAQHSIPAPPSGTCCVPSHRRCAGPGARRPVRFSVQVPPGGAGEHVAFSAGTEELPSPLGSASGPSILPGMGPVPALNPFLVSLDLLGSRFCKLTRKKQFRSYYFNWSLYKQNTYTF